MNFQPPTPATFSRIAKGQSGVYAIRETGGPIVYIGESHTGRLRKTAARHFQKWRGPAAGMKYSRAGHEIHLEPLPDSKAIDRQNELIKKHRPRDNTAGKPEPKSRRTKGSNPWDPF